MLRRKVEHTILILLVLMTVLWLLTGCNSPREAGRKAGEAAKETQEDAEEFADGFREAYCGAAVLPLGVALVAITTWRRRDH